MNRSSKTYLIASFAYVLAAFFLAGTVSAAEYEITATIDNPGDGTGQISGAPSDDPILKFSGWKGKSCSGVDKIDRCVLRGVKKNDTKEVTVTFAAPCTAFYYTPFGECDASGRMYRAVTSAIPSGCTGGDPVLAGSCTYIRIDPVITRVIDQVVDWAFPPPPPPPPPEVKIFIDTLVSTKSENIYGKDKVLPGFNFDTGKTETINVSCTGCITIIQKVTGNESPLGVIKSADTAGTGGETTKDSSGNVIGQIPQPDFSYYSEDTNETTIVSFVKDLANSVGSYFGFGGAKTAPAPTTAPAPIPSPTAKTAPDFNASRYIEVKVDGTKEVKRPITVFVPEQKIPTVIGTRTTKTTTRNYYRNDKNGELLGSETTTEIFEDGKLVETKTEPIKENSPPKTDLSEPAKSSETDTGGLSGFLDRAGDAIGSVIGAIGNAIGTVFGAVTSAVEWAFDKISAGLGAVGDFFRGLFGGGDSSPSAPPSESAFSNPIAPRSNETSSGSYDAINSLLNGGNVTNGGCGQDFGEETLQEFVGVRC